MKHKLLFLFLAFVASVGTIFATEIDGINYSLDNEKLTATVISSSRIYAGEVVIPSSVTYSGKTYVVTGIGSSAFEGCTGLTSVTIPNSVISIGGWAFNRCSGLTSVTIPNSVTSIGNYAFRNCNGLTSVTIPNSVTSIGNYAFSGCTGLPIIDNIRYADTYLVEAVDKTLSSYTIKEGTRLIGDRAFYGCTNMTSITIPNSITSIGEYAFSGCTEMTSVTIPNRVTSIGFLAFSNCTDLTSITISESVTSMEWSFLGCTSLISVHIKDIASWCNVLFGTCYNGGSQMLLPNPLYYAHHLYLNDTEITDLVIPNGVTTINDGSFIYCTGLTSVMIPNTVVQVGDSAFFDCTNITSITCSALVPPTLGTAVYNNVNKSIPLYVPAESIEAYKAADQWKDFTNILPIKCLIASGTCGATEADSVVWELSCDSVLTISGNGTMANYWRGNNATWYSLQNKIKEVIISDGITSIGNYAFDDCTNLISVTISESVISIGRSAFNGCTSLTSVTIPNSVTSIGNYAFSGCTGLPIIDNIRYADTYLVEAVDKTLTDYKIKDGTRFFSSRAFSCCRNMNSISIPKSVVSIDIAAFEFCTGLTAVHIFDLATWCNISFAEHGYYAPNPLYYAHHLYLNDTEITDLVIPESVTSIKDGVFICCTGLTSVTIPNTVVMVGDSTFSDCTNLTSITCHALIPPTLGTAVYNNVNKSIPLYVPAESIEAYKAANGWKEFTNIFPIQEEPIEEALAGTYGTEFWLGFLSNGGYDPKTEKTYKITLYAVSEKPVTISAYLGTTKLGEFTNATGSGQQYFYKLEGLSAAALCPPPDESEKVSKRGICVMSAKPDQMFSCYAITEAGGTSANSMRDATLLLPKDILEQEYFIQTYPEDGMSSEFIVVATEDETKVNITPSCKTIGGAAGGNALAEVMLNKGEVYMVKSQKQKTSTDIVDLSGSAISADKPIAVFNGNEATKIPNNGSYSANHTFEQCIPKTMWGTDFFIGRAGGTLRNRVQITAAYDETNVTYTRSSGSHTIQLNRGESLGATNTIQLNNANQWVIITADHPVLCYTYLGCGANNSETVDVGGDEVTYTWGNPANALIVPWTHRAKEMSFYTQKLENQTEDAQQKYYVQVVTAAADKGNVKIDGTVIPAASFNAIGTDGKMVYANVEITTHGKHHLSTTGSGFTGFVHGMTSEARAYQYTLGFDPPIDNTCHSYNDTIWRIVCETDTVHFFEKNDRFVKNLTGKGNNMATVFHFQKEDESLGIERFLKGDNTYSRLYQTVNGCDSIVTLKLYVCDTIYHKLDTTVCEKELKRIIIADENYPNRFYGTKFITLNQKELKALAEQGKMQPYDSTYRNARLTKTCSETDLKLYLDHGCKYNGCPDTFDLHLTIIPQLYYPVNMPVITEWCTQGDDNATYPWYRSDGTLIRNISQDDPAFDPETNIGYFGKTWYHDDDPTGCPMEIDTLVLHMTKNITVTKHICLNETYQHKFGDDQNVTYKGWDYQDKLYPQMAVEEVKYIKVGAGTNACEYESKLILYVHPTYSMTNNVNTELQETDVVCLAKNAGEYYQWDKHVDHVLWSVTEKKYVRGDTIPCNKPGKFVYIDSLKTLTCKECNDGTGCDSIVNLHLIVNPTYEQDLSVVLCQGGSYKFDGKTFTTSTEYTGRFKTMNGCDSIVNLHLTVNPRYMKIINAEIKAGKSYTFHGNEYNQSADYTWSGFSVAGCDSIEILTLRVDSNFVITFKNEDGTILEQATWKYEEIPQYTGNTPQKQSNAQYSYEFNGWDSPIVLVTSDVTYTAVYRQIVNTYTITLNCNDKQGTLVGAGEHEYGSNVQIEAIEKLGWQFIEWNDHNTDNPRTITLVQDTILSAFFEQITLDEVVEVESGETDALFEWHPVLFGLFYKLFVYYDYAHTQLHAVLTFDAVGNLIFIDYIHHTPKRTIAQNEAIGGITYQVTELQPGTTYYYVLQALEEDKVTIIDETEGVFTTKGTATDINPVVKEQSPAEKVFYNGILYILRNGKTYTVHGQEVK